MNFLHANDEPPKKNTGEVPEWAEEQEAAVAGDNTKAARIAAAGEIKASPAKASTSPTKKRKVKK